MKPADFFGTVYDAHERPNPYLFSAAMLGLGFVNVFLVCFAFLAAFDSHTFFEEHFTGNLGTLLSLEGRTLGAYFVMCVAATGIVIFMSMLFYAGGPTSMRAGDIVSVVLYLFVYEPIAALLIGLHVFSLSLLNPFQRSPLLPRVDTTPEGQISPIVAIASIIAAFALFSYLVVRCGALVTAFHAFNARGGKSMQFFAGFAPVYLFCFWLIPSVIYFFAGLAISGFH